MHCWLTMLALRNRQQKYLVAKLQIFLIFVDNQISDSFGLAYLFLLKNLPACNSLCLI